MDIKGCEGGIVLKKHSTRFVLWSLLLCVFLLLVFTVGCDPKKKGEGSSSSDLSSSSSASSTVASSALNSSVASSASSEAAVSKPMSGDGSADEKTLLTLDNTKTGWSHGYGAAKPAALQNLLTKYGACWIGNRNSPNIYLTFDEGYEYGLSGAILDTLKAKNVKAVFFVTLSFVKKNPQLVQRMIDEGHTLGNHSCNHPSFPTKDIATDTSEIMTLHQYMKDTYHYDMTLFRFPYGEYSERTLALVRSLNYTSVFWSFGYVDWDTEKQPTKEDALKLIEGKVHNGAIYLLHPESKTNADILGDVIDYFRDKGYTISLLTGNFD